MSDETIMKFKIATLFNILLGIISIAVTVMAIWLGGMSNTVAAHDRDIATLKECTMNLKQTAARIETTVEDIRKDQMRKRVDHK